MEELDAQGGDRLAAVLGDPEPAVRCLAYGAEFVIEQDLPGRSPDLPDEDEGSPGSAEPTRVGAVDDRPA